MPSAPRRPVVARTLVAYVALALAALFCLAAPATAAPKAPAGKCDCAKGTFAKQLRQADQVMVGRVEFADAASDADTLHVVVSRVFKGQVDEARVEVLSRNSGSCRWYDPEVDTALLLVVRDGVASRCTGARVASGDVVQRVQRQLGGGKRIAPPPPREATRTKVEESGPEEFGRLAAPGGAAILLGLLGLAVVSRVNRH